MKDSDLQKLENDWQTHPCLRKYACKNINELAEYVKATHKFLMSDDSMIMGYLYQKQVAHNNKLKEELKQCQ